MRIPGAVSLPRVKRWTDQHPSAARTILVNRLVHVLDRLNDSQAYTNDLLADRLAWLEAEKEAQRKAARAARRRVP